MSSAELSRSVDLLVRQVGHWDAPRWGVQAFGADARRGDLLHGLVQRLADLAAEAEDQPLRRVPRLPNDTALPDQLRVVATDLIAANPPASVAATATAEVTAIRRAL